jgi:hypothetical protein
MAELTHINGIIPDVFDWFVVEEREGAMGEEIRLVLGLPDSPNRWPKHPMVLHRAKRRYQRRVWVEACSQVKPLHDPPSRVEVHSKFYVRNVRDEDNLKASLKWVLDALKQAQKRDEKGRTWRKGLADDKGYFIDDDPAHCRVAEPTQVVDRSDPRVEITVRAA